jgi:ATP-dependent helicase/nuclease subunit B
LSPIAPLVLTPTARLARTLSRRAALERAAEGAGAWLPPRILSFPGWLADLRETHFLTASDHRVPISAHQALWLWQSLIDRDVFIGDPEVAALAQRAWRLIHEHALDAPERWPELLLSEDSRAFRGWADAYRAECDRRGVVDEWAFAGELPRLIESGQLAVPQTLELAGFDLPMSPLQVRIVDALEGAGCSVIGRPERSASPSSGASSIELTRFHLADDELRGAAGWARSLLEAQPGRTVAVVVPDLSGRLERVESIFREVFDPPASVLGPAGPVPFHISLGRPLADWPLVADALAFLDLDGQRLTQPQAGRLLRSPLLAGWQEEALSRSRALAHLAGRAPFEVTVNELRWALDGAGSVALDEALQSWQALREAPASPAWPSEWAGRFQQELTSIGFAAGRPLDSREFQVLNRWHDLLESFGALDVVAAGPWSRRHALRQLSERARAAVFRERNPGVPVEVLGVEEAVGSRFDAVWITTLDNTTWPGSPMREPLIPAVVQASVPRASGDGCLALAQLELDALCASAPEVRGSYARGVEDKALEITGLLRHAPVADAPPPAPVSAARFAEPIEDAQAPPRPSGPVGGGTGVLRDQSACPFKAFARWRLGAVDLTPPRPGLDAADRGTVIHSALERFWKDLEGLAALRALDRHAREQRISAAAAAAVEDVVGRHRAILTPGARRLEERRAARALARWLELEVQRAGFEVADRESDVVMTFAGLELAGKIDRLDRLPDGRLMLIDYKTGRTSRTAWLPEPRIVDPQLPAYAVSMPSAPAAITFARIRPDDLRFDGVADGDPGAAGVIPLADAGPRYREVGSWQALLSGWRGRLDALAGDFLAGHAAVDPRDADACATCHLHAICRVRDRDPYRDSEGGSEDE